VRSGRITIHDVAAIAGVSAGTVSRVINDREGVGEETRQRIRQIIDQHGFTANSAAQKLSTGRANSIGVVSPMHTSQLAVHPVYPILLGALGDAAADSGYDILLLSIPSLKEVSRLTDAVNRRRVDGIVLPAAGPDDPFIKELSNLKFPTVIIGHREKSGRMPWVDSAHDVASFELTNLLLEAGRRRLLMLNGPSDTSAFELRSKGFWSAVERFDGKVEAEEHAVEFGADVVKENVSGLLRSYGRALPTGIVAGNDTIGAACLEVARQLDVDVPGRLAVTGFDDFLLSAYTSPPLTTVRMPLRELGSTAAEMLFRLIEGRPLRRRHVILPAELVIRSSTPPSR
jgi:LacI family transcriptional regulator